MKWPEISFPAVPPTEAADELATYVRRAVFGSGRGLISHCDLKLICAAGRFEVRKISLGAKEESSEALLVPMPDNRFRIALNTNTDALSSGNRQQITRHRNRFRIAHEIAHSFFYDRSAPIPTKLTDESTREEKFCDRFASALLMPPSVVAVHPLRPESIFDVRRKFDVSIEAASRAFSEVFPEVSIVGLMWKQKSELSGDALRVLWSCGPRFVPRNARLKSEVAAKAYESGSSDGTETLNIGKLQGEFETRAAKAPGGLLVVVILRNTGDHVSISGNESLPQAVSASLGTEVADYAQFRCPPAP